VTPCCAESLVSPPSAPLRGGDTVAGIISACFDSPAKGVVHSLSASEAMDADAVDEAERGASPLAAPAVLFSIEVGEPSEAFSNGDGINGECP
jgi:hypothetical protein